MGIMKMFENAQEYFKTDHTAQRNLEKRQNFRNSEKSQVHTLKTFAEEHFRSSYNVTQSRGSSLFAPKRTVPEKLRKHTRTPINFAQLCERGDEIPQQAVAIFSSILKYMGDIPSNRQKLATEYTDLISKPALEHVSEKKTLFFFFFPIDRNVFCKLSIFFQFLPLFFYFFQFFILMQIFFLDSPHFYSIFFSRSRKFSSFLEIMRPRDFRSLKKKTANAQRSRISITGSTVTQPCIGLDPGCFIFVLLFNK